MRDLRSILIFVFLLPAFALAQTVHVDNEKIVYKGDIKLKAGSTGDLFADAKNLLLNYVNRSPDSLKEDEFERQLASTALIQLPSPYHLKKHLLCTVKFKVKDDEIDYEINNVILKLQERGDKPRFIPSHVLLKKMEENGKVARETERQLNEIDMYIQRMIAMMKSATAMNK
jgi:hypothetical protein